MAAAHAESCRAATHNLNTNYRSLEENSEAGGCTCGGGFTALATALTLSERGFPVVVLEKNHVGRGASGCNGN
jgi:heterodisulfide reductase subunit A-like polyferredoxin